jgi:lipid-A-disaccharide synthase-like uncharacterized protein
MPIPSVVYGAAGGFIVLAAYLAELFEHIEPENKWFLLANLIGSALLFIYAWLLGSSVFMVTNTVWALGSAYELWKTTQHQIKR